ncbi:unnamed protein product, partial [Effrenium voratum]
LDMSTFWPAEIYAFPSSFFGSGPWRIRSRCWRPPCCWSGRSQGFCTRWPAAARRCGPRWQPTRRKEGRRAVPTEWCPFNFEKAAAQVLEKPLRMECGGLRAAGPGGLEDAGGAAGPAQGDLRQSVEAVPGYGRPAAHGGVARLPEDGGGAVRRPEVAAPLGMLRRVDPHQFFGP